MKKTFLYILLFIITLLISFLACFPTESAFVYAFHQLEEKSKISIQYKEAKFGLNRALLQNVEISRDSAPLFSANEIKTAILPSKVVVEGKKNDGTFKADINKDKVVAALNNLQIVTDSKKLFKTISMSGNFEYNPNEKTGTGKFDANLKDSLDPLIKTDIQAVGNLRFSQRGANIEITNISGANISGNGLLEIMANQQNFSKSMLSGTLYLNTEGMMITLKISGTIDDPKANPQIGMNDKMKAN